MTKLKEELKKLGELKEFVVLATVKAKNYQKINLEIVKNLTKELNIPGVYVTLNKPYLTMKDIFKKAGIDVRLIIFIDAATKVEEQKKEKDCLFIGNPENLSDISIAMDQAVRALPKDKFLFFDSLNTLLIYNEVPTVLKFIHFLASKMRVWKVKGIIISLEKKRNKELIDELSQFCDIKLDL